MATNIYSNLEMDVGSDSYLVSASLPSCCHRSAGPIDCGVSVWVSGVSVGSVWVVPTEIVATTPTKQLPD